MSGAALLIWAAVIALALIAPGSTRLATPGGGRALIVGGGVVFPIAILTALLLIGTPELARVLTPGTSDGVSLEIVGTQWWWRVRYVRPNALAIELANEIHLPVGTRMNARVTSTDVVHSFWVPPVAGKMDMIPGRVNRIALQPTRPGTFRGACAEFCGTSHARMNLLVVAEDPPAFEAWLAQQAQPAVPPSSPDALRGQASFLERGCSACHTVRGTQAVGVVGPDLTHVGSRQTLAAGLLRTSPEDFRRWVEHTERLKPGAHMPAFEAIGDDELTALASYLAQLR